jgi:chloramphenicol 3-O phosphotransferase
MVPPAAILKIDRGRAPSSRQIADPVGPGPDLTIQTEPEGLIMKAGATAPGRITVLHGTSSSGKSGIVRALQGILEEPLLDAGIDKLIWMRPRPYLERPLWDEVLGLATDAGPVAHRLVSGMHQSIAALSRAANNVVADHVLIERRWLAGCAVLFSELPALFVGVRCPLDGLEQREAARVDRTLGHARAQFRQVHAHGIYDLEVDKSTSSAEACALQIKRCLEEGESPDALERLRQLRTLSDTLAGEDSG